MRVVVVGAAGRLASAIVSEMSSRGYQVTGLLRADLDVSDREQVLSTLGRLRPDVIVNGTAYNAVDAAEKNPQTAFATNAVGPACLAEAAAARDALLVHYSTDFVFDGTATSPYVEEDPTSPLSVYGASKLAGEREAAIAPRHYVLRVESIFGGVPPAGQRATIDYFADALGAGNTVRAIVDRTVSPSYVPDVVAATIALIERSAPHGIYHCANGGWTTWYELAHEVARQLGVPERIEPVSGASLDTPAARPQFCALSCKKLALTAYEMPAWQSAIARHLAFRAAQLPA